MHQDRKAPAGCGVRFLANSDKGQFMTLAAAAAASGIIQQELAEMAVR